MNLIREYKRPWKLFTLAIGIGLLILGAVYLDFPDWDIPISFIMAFFTYLTASWSLHVVTERRWNYLPLALFFTWFTIDGCYYLYWVSVDPYALVMRPANFVASFHLYLTCGVIWYFEGTLKEMFAKIRKLKYSGIYGERAISKEQPPS